MSVLYRDNTDDMNEDTMSHLNLKSSKSINRKRNNEESNDDNQDADNIYNQYQYKAIGNEDKPI